MAKMTTDKSTTTANTNNGDSSSNNNNEDKKNSASNGNDKDAVKSSVSFDVKDTTASSDNNNNEDTFDPRQAYQTKNRGVRFPSKDDVMNERFNISRLSTYELEEVMAVWGNKEEQVQKRNELKQEVREFAQGRRLSDSETWTSMGLTDKIGIGRLEKQHYRQEAYEAVLGTQETQRLMALDGLDQDETSPAHPAIKSDVVAAIYSTTTQPASLKAHQEAVSLQHALHDEKEK